MKSSQWFRVDRARLLRSSVAVGSLAVGLISGLQPNIASAQSAEQTKTTDGAPINPEIVVTGTLIRGIAPAGTNTIAMSKEAVEETGASTTTQLLQSIPQFGSFNTLQTPVGGGNFVTTNRPNLRNLPGFTTTGGSSTLMLVDGHRIVGMGISSTTPDSDAVPPGIIERVEIIPDGGSAIYGADAVAGVVNFITRKNINGVEADARYGFADDYYTVDANLTAGKTWTGGSAYISYNFSKHDAIYGRDRDWARTFPANRGFSQAVTEIQCAPGNVVPYGSGNVYGLPFTSANAATKQNVINQCDLTDGATVYPKERRHSVFAGLDQQLNDALKFEVRAFYMNRKMYSSQGQFNSNNLLASLPIIPGVTYSPFVAQHRTSPGFFELQQVYYAIGDSDSAHQDASVEAWGVVPTFTYDLGNTWQARLMASYGESTSEQHSTSLNANAINLALPSGLFNPYDPEASDPATLAAVQNWESFGLTRQRLFDARLVVDGDLVKLPGGAAKLAFGAEYINEGFDAQRGNTVPGFENSAFDGQLINGVLVVPPVARIPINRLSRNTKALFGELVVPVFGESNATAGLQELTLSASGRYDHYSDFGGTFNPKFGLTWRPFFWIKMRGAWGKSFAAPSLADNAAADPVAANWASGGVVGFLAPTSVLVANGYPAPTASQNTLLVLLGGSPDLKPQKATTWSLGTDIDPPFLPGLRLSGTYFNINYNNLIAQPPFTVPTQFFSTFRDSFIVNPSQAQIDAAVGSASSIVGAPCSPLPNCVYIIEDVRKANLGRFRLSGLDFAANYFRETGFGSIDFNLNASYELTRKQSATSTSEFIDVLDANVSRFRMRSSIGTWIGSFRAQATWSHTHGYKLDPVVPAAGPYPEQTRIAAFNVIDLFFKYNLPGDGAFKDLSVSLGVNNVFDQDPPEYRAQQITLQNNGIAPSTGTVGRLVQFGVAKKF